MYGRLFVAWNLLSALALVAHAAKPEIRQPSQSNGDRVIAIDVLLEPGPVMVAKAEAANAKLRANYPEGYTLGRDQVAHISLVHRYVHEKDLPAINAAVSEVAAKERPLQWQL